VTVFTQAVPAIGIRARAFYASRLLREDMLRIPAEQRLPDS
jgi:hypothetical protein